MDYLALQRKAAALIAANGSTWTLSRSGSVLGTIKGIRTSAKKTLEAMPLSIQAEGELILAAGGIEPKPGDTVSNGTSSYTLQTVETTQPGSTPLIYKVKT